MEALLDGANDDADDNAPNSFFVYRFNFLLLLNDCCFLATLAIDESDAAVEV